MAYIDKPSDNVSARQRTAALEERFIDFAVRIVRLTRSIPKDYASQYYGKQILRSGGAPALLYGEAQGAESRKDFRHKLSIAVKELRETHVNLKIIAKSGIAPEEKLGELIDECNELISILTASIKTIDYKVRNGLD